MQAGDNEFGRYVAEDARLVLLRTLAQDADYSLNDRLLAMAAKAMGHDLSADLLRAQLDWLAEQALVSLVDLGNVSVATLTRRGLDVAAGRVRASGVARPMPGYPEL